MPDRQIPWRTVATRLSGKLDVKTGITGTQLELVADVDGIKIHIDAISAPYASSGGRTEVRALAEHSFGSKIFLMRNLGTVPLYRRFLLRDVIIGAPIFDEGWIINASRESHAQAFLDPEVCSLIDKVPRSHSPASFVSELREVYYDFRIRGREVMAYTDNFETDPNRLSAAIAAAVALANQHKSLLGQWRALAHELDGNFEHGPRFRLDGSTRIRFPIYGRPIEVAPVAVALQWRRDRLRTRVRCEAAGGRLRDNLHWTTGDDVEGLGTFAPTFRNAVEESGAVSVRSSKKMVEVLIDGNVRRPTQILAAGSLAALLAQGDEHAGGPYR